MTRQVSFTQNHPERQEDEVYIGNFTSLSNIGWKTKRIGVRAFSTDGKEVVGVRPVFVKRAELSPNLLVYYGA